MSAMLQDTPEVFGAYKQYKEFSADPVMREKVRVRQRYLDEKHILLTDAREEGLAEGRAEGLAEKAVEIARNLKNIGIPLGKIAEATGLSVSEIEQLN